jgi:hypothetical protein
LNQISARSGIPLPVKRSMPWRDTTPLVTNASSRSRHPGHGSAKHAQVDQQPVSLDRAAAEKLCRDTERRRERPAATALLATTEGGRPVTRPRGRATPTGG